MSDSIILGIDTSNYKTSVAVCSLSGEILADERILLTVKKGERGLRQSEALFQHVNNLPVLLEKAFETGDYSVAGIAVSTRPRPAEGSYMPCFNAGYSMAGGLAASHKVPLYETSHQEGHIAAIEGEIKETLPDSFLALHLSGGTCELLKVMKKHPGYSIELIGGSSDISFGQLLDRAGVAMGYPFPAGEYLDKLAIEAEADQNISHDNKLTGIAVKNCRFNLSGIETQVLKSAAKAKSSDYPGLSLELFNRITRALEKLTTEAVETTGINTLVFAGGVSSSIFISKKLAKYGKKQGYNLYFGAPSLSSDNAVGVARIGLKKYESDYSHTIK